ncbi:MAG: protoheme IX farnesyltransferase [Acidobacteria bacterium]|nr:protoheme IX farnesyltransferase [Acidobacteriota bacterium]
MTELSLPIAERRSVIADYLELSKARIVLLVLITTAAGYLMAAPHINALALLNLLVGTMMVAAGTNALNQYIEREHDAKMRRTRLRPLPDGRITPRAALIFSAVIAVIGTLYLGFIVNWLTAALGALTLTSYIFVYTPLKRISTICTIIGAVPGAIPPLMGWAAATGTLSIGAWIAFSVLFFWQLPHFMAISWIYREDYGRAGFVMTSVRDEDGADTSRQAVFFTLALVAVTILPTILGITGGVYLIGAIAFGALFIATAIRFFQDRSNRTAMRLFMTSNLYLIAVMSLLVVSIRA